MKLTKYEKQIEEEIISGKSTPITAKEKLELEASFRSFASKTASVNILLAPNDIVKLKSRAEKEGLPFQMLIGSVLHKFANGHLLDVENTRAVGKLLKKPQ